MRCKRMEEIILTDYIDGNLKGHALQEVESHLGSCPECRRLAEEAKTASGLLKAAPRHEAPPRVWNSIRAAIDAGPAKTHFAGSILERLRFFLPYPKPALVLATAVLLVLFVLTVARLMPGNGYIRDGAEQDDIFLISSINGGGDETGFGTPAEDFLL